MDSNKQLLFEVEWKKQELKLHELCSMGAQNYFTSRFSNLNQAFLEKHDTAVCIDEGTSLMETSGEGKICLAGLGMLYVGGSEAERLENVANKLEELKVRVVTSHSGCGAAGLAYRRDFPGKEPTPEEVNSYAIEWGNKVVDKMRASGREISHRYVEAEEMNRPAEFHNAVAVYYDGTGEFNAVVLRGAPQGFGINRKYLPAEYAQAELKIAVSIAFGHHGFGKKFSANAPFVIVIVAHEKTLALELEKEVAQILQTNQDFVNKRIKIESLVV